MLDFLMNHSIHIIFVITATFIGISEYRRYLQRTGLTPQAFRSSVRERFNAIGNELLAKFVASAAITLVISIVSFRELWMNDTFHVVFLTNLLYARTVALINQMFEK